MNAAAPIQAKRIRKLNVTAGGGGTLLLLLIVGGVVAAYSVIAAIILLAVLIGGFVLTNQAWVCGNCRKAVASGSVTVCPSCSAELS